jgi:hypothetical protein
MHMTNLSQPATAPTADFEASCTASACPAPTPGSPLFQELTASELVIDPSPDRVVDRPAVARTGA